MFLNAVFGFFSFAYLLVSFLLKLAVKKLFTNSSRKKPSHIYNALPDELFCTRKLCVTENGAKPGAAGWKASHNISSSEPNSPYFLA